MKEASRADHNFAYRGARQTIRVLLAFRSATRGDHLDVCATCRARIAEELSLIFVYGRESKRLS